VAVQRDVGEHAHEQLDPGPLSMGIGGAGWPREPPGERRGGVRTSGLAAVDAPACVARVAPRQEGPATV
jgi:hypothetical protein